MVSLNQSSAYNSFDFSMQTSDGDKISLNMYDNRSSETKRDGSSLSMSLTHSYGYEFSYRGNGLSEQDMSEIEEALKEVRPMLERYMERVEESDSMFGGVPLDGSAEALKAKLPEPKDAEHQEAIKAKTLEEFDDILAGFEENNKILESAKALFERLFSEVNRDIFSVYA